MYYTQSVVRLCILSLNIGRVDGFFLRSSSMLDSINAGLANAQLNAWPMILIGGSCERQLEGIGAFQEYPQVASCRLHTKYAARPSSVAQIPLVVEKVSDALLRRLYCNNETNSLPTTDIPRVRLLMCHG